MKCTNHRPIMISSETKYSGNVATEEIYIFQCKCCGEKTELKPKK